MRKKIAILGSTGSIGKTLIDIIKKDKKNFEIILLSADENYKELLKQAKFFKVKNLIITNTKSFNKIKKDKYSKKIKIYNNLINQILSENIEIKAMSHITGGGIPENLPRCIPSDFIPYINTSSWEIPILFKFLKNKGSIPEKDFWNTFNLGVGFCLIIDKQFKDAILSICKDYDIDSWEIGKIVRKNDSTISKFLPEILT